MLPEFAQFVRVWFFSHLDVHEEYAKNGEGSGMDDVYKALSGQHPVKSYFYVLVTVLMQTYIAGSATLLLAMLYKMKQLVPILK